jgi:hypothetical protein
LAGDIGSGAWYFGLARFIHTSEIKCENLPWIGS